MRLPGLCEQVINIALNRELSEIPDARKSVALLQEQNPTLAVGKTAADLNRAETAIAQSSLFTGAFHKLQTYTELKKKMVSDGHINMLTELGIATSTNSGVSIPSHMRPNHRIVRFTAP